MIIVMDVYIFLLISMRFGKNHIFIITKTAYGPWVCLESFRIWKCRDSILLFDKWKCINVITHTHTFCGVLAKSACGWMFCTFIGLKVNWIMHNNASKIWLTICKWSALQMPVKMLMNAIIKLELKHYVFVILLFSPGGFTSSISENRITFSALSFDSVLVLYSVCTWKVYVCMIWICIIVIVIVRWIKHTFKQLICNFCIGFIDSQVGREDKFLLWFIPAKKLCTLRKNIFFKLVNTNTFNGKSYFIRSVKVYWVEGDKQSKRMKLKKNSFKMDWNIRNRQKKTSLQIGQPKKKVQKYRL